MTEVTTRALERFLMARVRIEDDGCWIWTGSVSNSGYGQSTWKRRGILAHRAMYEVCVGPIPDGLTIDHLCRVPRCCNPLHLEAVTALINVHRAPNSLASINGAKTHCPQGHEYTQENTYHYRQRSRTGRTDRRCKACNADRARRWRAAKKVAA